MSGSRCHGLGDVGRGGVYRLGPHLSWQNELLYNQRGYQVSGIGQIATARSRQPAYLLETRQSQRKSAVQLREDRLFRKD